VTKIAPTGGSSAGGITVELTGTGLTDAAEVKFGSNTAQFTINSDTQITAISPPGTGIVDITVTTPTGTSPTTTAAKFTYSRNP